MAALAVVIAFCSASQDIVFDAWKTDVLPAEERGAGAAISVLGYRLGMLVSGGLALWLADRYLGWQGMYWLMAALLIPALSPRCSPRTERRHSGSPLAGAGRRRTAARLLWPQQRLADPAADRPL
jgi:MFS family permease